MKDEVAIIGTDGLPARYGGFETLIEQIAPRLARKFHLRIFCSSWKRTSKESQGENDTFDLTYLRFRANGFQSVIYDAVSIFLARKVNIMVILGPSAGFLFPLIRYLYKRKLIVHIDGLEWKRSQWGRLTRSLALHNEKMACRYADVIVSDNKAITEYLRESYPNIRTFEIAYGGDHAVVAKRTQAPNQKCVAYGLCRIVPENNVSLILEAFAKTPNWNLRFWGNWQNSEYGRELTKKFGSLENIELLSPEYEQKKLSAKISECCLYVHGHSLGGTNPSLVEAMYRGSNVACFNNDFNTHTTGGLGLFFSDSDSLKVILDKYRTPSHHLKESLKIREYAEQHYTWEDVAVKYESLLRSV